MYTIYWLISEDLKRTYVGFTDNVKQRLEYHKNKKVKTTITFGKFKCFKLEEVKDLSQAIIREKYWKSAAGRKKLKKLFDKIMASSSNG